MTDSTRDLFKRALELPQAERAQLIRELADSLEGDGAGEAGLADELEPEFLAELERRGKRAREPGIPAEEGLAAVERELAERRRPRA